jgi:hypothetical protein
MYSKELACFGQNEDNFGIFQKKVIKARAKIKESENENQVQNELNYDRHFAGLIDGTCHDIRF